MNRRHDMLAFNKDQFLVEVALATTIKNRLAAIDTTTKDNVKIDNRIVGSKDFEQVVVFVEQWKRSGLVSFKYMRLKEAMKHAQEEIQRLWTVNYDFYIIKAGE